MQWLQPWSFLWALLVVPGIIFLYLLKRRYTDRTISSTLLWRRVMQQMEVTRPWQRLQRHLLLLLQLLAAVLIIAAIARPAVPTDGVTADHTVVLFDTSGSMLAEEGETDRLTLAKAEAIKLADSLQAGQTMTVVETGVPPRVIVAETGDSRLLKQRLNEVQSRYDEGDTVEALSLAQALASRYNHSEVILISDGSGWEIPQSMAPDRYIAIGESKQNASVAHFSAMYKGEVVEALARLENTGTERLTGTLLLYDEEDRPLDTQTVEIEAKRSLEVMWPQLPTKAFYRVELEVENDALTADNERWAVPMTPSSHDVLYAGEGNAFLEKALRLSKRANIVKAVDEEDGAAMSGHYSLYVLNESGTQLPERGNGLFVNPTAEFAGWNWGGDEQLQTVIEQTDHPMLEHVSLSDVYIAEGRALEVPPGWQTVVHSGDVPLVLVKEEEGQRFVVFTFDLKRSDLPLRPQFPVLMHQVVNWLMPEGQAQLSAGQPDEALTIPVTAESERVIVTSPSGEGTALHSEQFNVVYTPQEIGLYEVRTEGGGGDPQFFAVHFPEAEADIAPNPLVPTQQNSASSGATDDNRNDHVAEIGRWLALTVLLVLGAEWVVFARGH